MRIRLLITLVVLGALAGPAPASAQPSAGVNGKIVFSRSMGPPNDVFGHTNHDIFVENPDGSGAVDITAIAFPGNGAYDDTDPAVSPDGTRIAFASDRGASYDIFVMNADGSGTPLRVTSDVKDERGPAWSPDGNTIAYSLQTLDPTKGWDLFEVRADGTGPHSVEANNGDDLHPAFSPDGVWLAWSSAGQMFEANADGSSGVPLIVSGSSDDYPTWSPDSTRLAWTCSGVLCIWGTDGYTLGQVPGPQGAGGRVTWSPDGSKLLYTSAGLGLRTINPDGSGGTFLGGAGTDSVGDWLPGGLVNTRVPAISGARTVGSTLVADAGIWNGSGSISYTYQWKRCNPTGANGCAVIAGATSSTYTTTTTDLNASLRVFVGATGSAGSATAASAGSGAITNPLSNVLPTIGGTLAVDGVVTASTGNVGSGLGLAPLTFSYIWQRCDTTGLACSTIAGATSSTYTVVSADGGYTLRVGVTATNTAGSASATSLATAVVTVSPVNTVIPTISGSPILGQRLNATSGTWLGAGILYSYLWKRCDATGNVCVTIDLAVNSIYTVVSVDGGHALRVVVTATNLGGSASALSLATGTVGTLELANTVIPSIGGSLTIGGKLTASPGTWTGSGVIAYTYQWKRCDVDGGNCRALTGATSSTYTLTSDDAGQAIELTVTGTNSFGVLPVESLPTAIVGAVPSDAGPGAPASTVSPHLVGAPTVGSVLTSVRGGFVGAGLAYRYQWQRCNRSGDACNSIAGATLPTYKLRQLDVGSTIRVSVTASNGIGSASAVSDETSVIVVAPRTVKQGTTQRLKKKPAKKHATAAKKHATALVFRVTKQR
jgi:hypothetical protein